MPSDDSEKNNMNFSRPSRLDRLQKKLYSKQPDIVPPDNHRGLEKKDYDVQTDWQDGDVDDVLAEGVAADVDEELKAMRGDDVVGGSPLWDEERHRLQMQAARKKRRPNFFYIFLVFALIFFIGSISYAAFIFLNDDQVISNEDIKINIAGPVSVGGGEPLSVDIIVQNNSPVTLESTDFVIDYPDGTKALDLISDLLRDRISVGDIKPGQVVKKTLDFSFLGENGEVKEIDVEVEYRLPGSNAFFDQTKSFSLTLSAAPVIVNVSAVDQISSGQLLDLELDISSNSEKNIQKLMVIANYPFGFNFESASIDPRIGNNIWIFDNLAPDEKQTIKISGRLDAQDDEERYFRFNAGIVSPENPEEIGIIFTNVAHAVTIEKPFIDLDLLVNSDGSDTVVVESGQQTRVDVVFTNSTNDYVRDVEIQLLLDSTVLDKPSIKAGTGFYNSSDDTILFNKQTFADLEEVAPRGQTKLSFNMRTRDLAVGNQGFRNPDVKISARVTGRRISEDNVSENIDETEFRTIRVQSDVLLVPVTLYGLGPFSNGGPIPPRADQPTTYTILWSLSNSSNNIERTRIVATLPPYVKWNGAVSPSNEKISYDSNSRQITWDVGAVSAGIGYAGNARDVNFQITLTPSVSQIGTAPILVGDTKLYAYDAFTGTEIEQTVGSPTTVTQDQLDTAFLQHEFVIE